MSQPPDEIEMRLRLIQDQYLDKKPGNLRRTPIGKDLQWLIETVRSLEKDKTQ